MNYSFIDMHCDSLLKGIIDGQLYDHPGNMLDVSRMALAGQGAQFFAVFFPPKTAGEIVPHQDVPMPPLPPDDELFERARGLLLDTAAGHSNAIRMAYSAADIEWNMKDGLCSAILTIEDARAVNSDMAKLHRFYDAGVRAMSLTWNVSNCFGYPNSRDSDLMQLGLTDFGKEAILEMNRLGILVDVSHLSDGGFWDVAELSANPFTATHSNCRALCDHPRNLTDEMIKSLASKGGVAGVNFAPEFLSPDGQHFSRINDICRHVLHFINIGGEDCVGLGSDFDGIEGQFEIGQPTDMAKLFGALRQKGLSERQLEKFAGKNVLRMLHDTL
jgi:membrane dipeptidase